MWKFELVGPARGSAIIKRLLTFLVDTFVNWLYMQTLLYSPDLLSPEDEPDRVLEVNAIEAYILGNRFEAAGFKRAVLQALVAFYVLPRLGGVLSFSTIIYAFNYLPGKAIFPELSVDI